MHAPKITKPGIGLCLEPRGLTGSHNLIEIIDNQCRMRPLRWMKLRFDAKMQIHRTSNKPDAFTSSHRSGLLNFAEFQNAGVKLARALLAANRNRNLHVIKSKHWHM